MTNGCFSLLVCTNGHPASLPALEYGCWLGGILRCPIVLLGIVEKPDRESQVKQHLDQAVGQLEQVGLPYQVRLEGGRAPYIVAQVAHSDEYITVVGPLGRPVWRRALYGRSFRRLMAMIKTPILYVPQPHLRLNRLLLCMGGLIYTRGVEHVALYLARMASASVTLLHVVEPITVDYPVAREIHDHWKEILETRTPQAENLRRALAEIREAGLQVDFKVRYGHPVREILDEVRRGDYDLVGMGSPYSAHSLRHLFLPNVTAEVAESLTCPIITVRLGYELVPSGV